MRHCPQGRYSSKVQQRSLTAASMNYRPHPALAGTTDRRPAAPLIRDEEAAGTNPATPTTKLQVTAIFRDEFRLPIPSVSRFWERTGADLVQPTSLTSGNAPLFVRRVGAAASERRIRLLARPTSGRTGYVLTQRLPALIHPTGTVKLRPQPRRPSRSCALVGITCLYRSKMPSSL